MVVEWIVIGKVGKAKGLGGEFRVIPETDVVERFQQLESVWVGDEEVARRLEKVRIGTTDLRLKLEGIDTRLQAEEIRGQWLRIARSQAIPLSSNQFFIHDVIGLEVRSTDGTLLGNVVEILTGSATDVWIVRDDAQGEWLLPALADVLIQIDTAARQVTVAIPPGLERTPAPRRRKG